MRLASVEAQAHGSRWYSNTLKIRADAKYPMTLLVEEGKHATAPDRNADGSFMRGYDVTERVNDAWGVRDSLGQGVLLSSGYSFEMTKRRTEPFRLSAARFPLSSSDRPSTLVRRRTAFAWPVRIASGQHDCERAQRFPWTGPA